MKHCVKKHIPYQVDIIQLFPRTFSGERFSKVCTANVTRVVSSKVPVVSCKRYKSVILDHAVQAVAFIVRIQS